MLENTRILTRHGEDHSYLCAQMMRQLLQDDSLQPLPELTLDIDNGLTPDISVYKKDNIRPDFFEDVLKVKELPILAIEVISSSQNIQALLEKSRLLVNSGVKSVWIVEPYGRSVFVVTHHGKHCFMKTSSKAKVSKSLKQVFKT